MRIPNYAQALRKEVGLSRYIPSLDGRTFCNLFVREVASWHGFNQFNTPQTDQAGEMCRLMARSNSFRRVTFNDAQFCANRGNLVIAGEVNPTPPPTGHVCIIMPANSMGYSLKWLTRTPICANVGKTNYTDKGINWAFKKQPMIWVWDGSFN